ncbi:MAG: helix-turn-helix domain-containing protein [Bacteroidota bacterium]
MRSRLIVLEDHEIRRLVQEAVAEAVAAVTELHAAEAKELRRSLYVQKGLLTAAEAGRVLGGVGADTVMEYVRRKGLPCYRPGKAPLFRLEELQAWAARYPDGSEAG